MGDIPLNRLVSQAIEFLTVYTIKYSTVIIVVFSTIHVCEVSMHSRRSLLVSQFRPTFHFNGHSEPYRYHLMAINRQIAKNFRRTVAGPNAKI